MATTSLYTHEKARYNLPTRGCQTRLNKRHAYSINKTNPPLARVYG